MSNNPSLDRLILIDSAQAYFDLKEGPGTSAYAFRSEVAELLLPALRSSIAHINSWHDTAIANATGWDIDDLGLLSLRSEDQKRFVSNLYFTGLVGRFSQLKAKILKDFSEAVDHQSSAWPKFDPCVPPEFSKGTLKEEDYPLTEYADAARIARNRLVHDEGHVSITELGVQLSQDLVKVQSHFGDAVEELGSITFTPELVESAAHQLIAYMDSFTDRFEPSWAAMRENAKTVPYGPGYI